jgi:hypothetical protein
MNENGLQMFVMEELEECGKSIAGARELDYMRQLDSWNPRRGYNSPGEEAKYVRELYFLLNPGKRQRYRELTDSLRALHDGLQESLPQDQRLEEELRGVTETVLREGRRLMKRVSSLATPIVLRSPPGNGGRLARHRTCVASAVPKRLLRTASLDVLEAVRASHQQVTEVRLATGRRIVARLGIQAV